MIVVSVLYPKTTDSHFNHHYYLQTHMPLVRSRWQNMGLLKDTLFRGTSTLDGNPPAFELIATLTFESVEHSQKAIAAFGEEIIGDIPNFTNITPLLQLNHPVT